MLDRETVEIFDVSTRVFSNENFNVKGIVFSWESNIGFGEYTVYLNLDDGKWYGQSECMDHKEDKWFLKKILDKFISDITIEE